MHKNKAIAITQGDSAGIGPEIIAKVFREQPALLQGCFVVGMWPPCAVVRRPLPWLAKPRCLWL